MFLRLHQEVGALPPLLGNHGGIFAVVTIVAVLESFCGNCWSVRDMHEYPWSARSWGDGKQSMHQRACRFMTHWDCLAKFTAHEGTFCFERHN